MVREGKRRRELQCLLLGTYTGDLSLETGFSSQRKETGPEMPLEAHGFCFCCKLLLAVITSLFEFIFQKLMFIHHFVSIENGIQYAFTDYLESAKY